MAEIRIQIRQARQVQATEVQLQTEGVTRVGELLRGFPAPATQDTLLGRCAITQCRHLGGTLPNPHIALALTAAGEPPALQLTQQRVKCLLTRRQLCLGGLAQRPNHPPGKLHAVVRV